jgi:hypothetical protein
MKLKRVNGFSKLSLTLRQDQQQQVVILPVEDSNIQNPTRKRKQIDYDRYF